MRKLPIIALVVCLMAGIAGSAFAADVYTNSFTAGIKFESTGAFTCAASLVNMDGSATTGEITWDSAIDLNADPKPSWVMASKAIKIESTISTPGSIEIFTDNTDTYTTTPAASPKFMGDTSIYGTTGGGLVCSEDAYASPLPLMWRIVDAPTDYFHPAQGAPGAVDRIYDTATGNAYPCYLWMEDASSHADVGGTWTANFNTTAVTSYRVVKDERGIQHAEAGFLPGIPSPDYVYIGANFANAVTPRTYRTNKIIVHAYTE